MKKIVIACLSSLLFIGIIVGAAYLYYEHKENKMAAFNYAKEFVVTEYSESTNLSRGGTKYDFGRGNYFVIVQNKQQRKYYLEVKLSSDGSLVSIEDNTNNLIETSQ